MGDLGEVMSTGSYTYKLLGSTSEINDLLYVGQLNLS